MGAPSSARSLCLRWDIYSYKLSCRENMRIAQGRTLGQRPLAPTPIRRARSDRQGIYPWQYEGLFEKGF